MTRHPPVRGASGLYVASSDGGAPRRLVAGDDIRGIAWSHDGTELVYSVDAQLWVVNAEGGPARAVTPTSLAIVYPSWSPSGNYIAYFATDDWAVGAELRVLDVRTGEIRTIGKTSPFGPVAWRSTGDIFAWVSRQLEVFNLATGKASGASVGVAGAPLVWRPDGQAIAANGLSGLRVYEFADVNNIGAGRITLDLNTPGMALYDPVWIGEEIYFVKPFVVESVRPDGTNRHDVVSDYTANLKYSPQRPDDLFLLTAPMPYNVGTRRIERAARDGSGRRVVLTPVSGQQIFHFELAPAGDLVAVTMGPVPPPSA